MRNTGLILMAIFGIAIGLYPVLYFVVDLSGGLIATKPEFVRESLVWSIAFYQHIIFGGLALLTGWSQFFRNIRRQHLSLHRTLGKIYVVVCLVSGIAGAYLAVFATGGIIASLGFGGLAIGWLYTTSRAYLAIRVRRIEAHRAWMIRSYALAFAAVMLRLWMPLFTGLLGLEFWSVYVFVAWFCWLPNLVVAELLIRDLRLRGISAV